MRVLEHQRGFSHILSLFVVISAVPKTRCLALSDRFYDDYLEAQSFLRGGIGFRELLTPGLLQQRSQSHHCSPGYVQDKEYTLCRMNYGSRNVLIMKSTLEISAAPLSTSPDTMWTTNSAVNSAVSTAFPQNEALTTGLANIEAGFIPMTPITPTISIPDQNTEGIRPGPNKNSHSLELRSTDGHDSKLLRGRSSATCTPTHQAGRPMGELIQWNVDFEQVAKVDSVSASASLHLSYDADRDIVAIRGSHTTSFGVWTTTSTYDAANISPFPNGLKADVRLWVGGDFDLAVRKIGEICEAAERLESATNFIPTSSEESYINTRSAQDITLQGSLFGTMIYNTATASWNGHWGPYDKASRTLPFNATVSGIDGSYTRLVSESWAITQLFAGRNEEDLVKQFAEIGPIGMVFLVSFRSSDGSITSWPSSDPRFRKSGDPIRVNAIHPIDSRLPTTRDFATIVVPAVTEVVTKTEIHTNTHIPLFGRLAKAKGTSARTRTQGGPRFLLWMPWVLFLCILLLICTFSLAWHRIYDFIDRQKRWLRQVLGLEVTQTPSYSQRPSVRKASGSRASDPARLKATRQRGSKESFQSIELH
ncbi:hypothetical protein TWF730_003026 [Orbilia blumenaviensis]|uniref:Transmembrane protein n=1 Tax=Orbilia blumenaviensis TaxID=1796055 RepID=A0AAV9UAH3_9PEZI